MEPQFPPLDHGGWGALIQLPPTTPSPLCLLSLKLECDKLASEKSEMQRHYVMVK